MSQELYTVFRISHFDKETGWVTTLAYYLGDLDPDLDTDWRFKAVDGKRAKAERLGICFRDFAQAGGDSLS